MGNLAKFASRIGCLVSVLGPFIALVLYPRVKWLFAFALIGFAIIAVNHLLAKEPTPEEVAKHAERLLNGTFAGWDVDNYEHLNVGESKLRELWVRTIEIGGAPEGWVRLDEAQKSQLLNIIGEMRALTARSS